jgi:DNA-binding transcriptional LysR family regulator
VAALKKSMPGLHIMVEIGTEAQITDQLLTGVCDVGVVAFTQSHHPAVTAHRIGVGEVVCAMASTHPLAKCDRIRLAQLRQFDVISFGADSAHGRAISLLLGDDGEQVRPTVEVRYAYLACSIASSGWGVALVDDMSVRRFEQDGLVLRPLEEALQYSAYALASAEFPLSTAGRSLIGLLGAQWDGARARGPAAGLT